MNSNLQKKLFRFEETPPEAAWEKIAEELNNESSFSNRLSSYEETPPSTVWTVVNASLDEEKTKVVPFFSQYKRPLRYVAAASVIAALLAVLTLNNHQVQVNVPETANRITPAPPSKLYPHQKPLPPQTSNENEASIAANAFRSPRGERESGKRLIALVRPQNILPTFSLQKKFIPKQVEQQPLVDQASAENFMVYSDGEGNVMRLPKKLFSLVCCKDGDGSCKVRLQRLRQTLSANVAPIDFGGMIDMLRQLQ